MLASATPPRKVFYTIQILRGVAALIVVLFHLTLGHQRRGQDLLIGGLFQNGFAGVDLFFVISGFVIMHTSHWYFNTPAYFGTYLRKRLIRIYPIYWITLVFIIAGILLIQSTTQQRLNELPTSWYLILSSFLLLPNHPNINGVTWSLSYELYYYVLFGLLILSRRLWPLVAIVLVLSAIAVLNPTSFILNSTWLAYFFSPYNLEFASGIMAWWIINRYRWSSFIYSLLLALSGVWLLSQESIRGEEASGRVALYGISSFLLVLSFTGLERNGWYKPSFLNQILMKIGDASYLIYIIHFPILPFYGKMLEAWHLNVVGQHILAVLFATILTGICIYLHVHFEAPLVKQLNLYFKLVRVNPTKDR